MAKRGSKKKTTASTRALPLLRRSAGETGTAESKEETGAASPIKNAIKNAAAGEMGEEETAAMGITRTRGDQETPRKKKGRSW